MANAVVARILGRKKMAKAERAAALLTPMERMLKGDKDGHPFHGNQHSGGQGGGDYSTAAASAKAYSGRAKDADTNAGLASNLGKEQAFRDAAKAHGEAEAKHKVAATMGNASYHNEQARQHGLEDHRNRGRAEKAKMSYKVKTGFPGSN